MAEFREVAEGFWVAPQITEQDVQEAARRGFRSVINNRPDGEEPGQPANADLRQAAEAAGLAWFEVPTRGVDPERVQAMEQALGSAERPVLAFCRSGTRSISLWALAEAVAGRRTRDELVRSGADAGYDLGRLPL